MIVIEGLKDGPVKGDVCVLTLFGEESVIEHFEDKALLVGKWKVLKTHGRLIDADELLKGLSDCEMKAYGYNGSCDECEDRNICRERILIQRIKDAQTVLEANNGTDNQG